ncbi:YbhB/YbcL family Raf kinase inhibitor-like protein [Bdellovibrio bacteriovorus]|uniref:YbhB/YbcL family Raf kinase inhibitor-like protein n=1 Tax=Bdellovibrio bacteriovorus TaxID=959 RepID=UPI0035A8EBBD
MQFTLESSAFKPHEEIPKKYTCEGDDKSPPLRWKGSPAGTKSFVIIVDDPDAPDPEAPKQTWVHWVLYNIPHTVNSLPENVDNLPKGAHEGLNDWSAEGYRGPCPPIGTHHYHHKIYALDTVLPNMMKPSKADLEKAMKGHVLAQADLVATYKKHHH